jgi:AraC-like DNA-binding protein
LVTLLEGRGRWTRGEETQDLEPQVPWWSDAGTDQRWLGGDGARWLCLAGDRCPLAPGQGRIRRCPAAVPDVRELAEIVANCPFPCELKDLLTQGKCLMVVSKAWAALSDPQTEPSYGVRFFEDDLDRVREARTLLLNRMEAPPTLPELARLAGLNEVKLKAGFRRLWGTTVFGLLRRERMAAARKFLLERRGTVGEAAYRVGYTNTSHFAEAFQKEFGVPPGALVRSLS